MKKIFDHKLLTSYIETYSLNSIFKEKILGYMELFKFDKGELICTKDSEIEYMYFLVEGKIKVSTLHDNGKSILLRFNKPLSIFGDIEFLTDYKVQCNAEAQSQALLIGIKMDILRTYAYEDTKFLQFIIKNLSEKLYVISNSTSINLSYNLENRLASYIISIIDDENNLTNKEVDFSKPTEIASLLGTSYRHLNRVIQELVSKGIIEKNKKIVTVKNLKKLKELSDGNIYEN